MILCGPANVYLGIDQRDVGPSWTGLGYTTGPVEITTEHDGDNDRTVMHVAQSVTFGCRLHPRTIRAMDRLLWDGQWALRRNRRVMAMRHSARRKGRKK